MDTEELVEAIFQRDLKINKLKKENKLLKELYDPDYIIDIIKSFDSDIRITPKFICKYDEIYRYFNKKGIRD